MQTPEITDKHREAYTSFVARAIHHARLAGHEHTIIVWTQFASCSAEQAVENQMAEYRAQMKHYNNVDI